MNLRIATKTQNNANAARRKDNNSGAKGVYLSQGRWRAQIRVNGTKYHLGYFNSLDAAAESYRAAAIEKFGEFARV